MSELTNLLSQAFSLGWSGGVVILALLLYFLFGRRNDPDRSQLAFKTAIGLLGYAILCIAIANYKQHFFGKSYLLPLSLAMIAAASFMLAAYYAAFKDLLRICGFMFAVTAMLSGYGNWLPQTRGGFPPKEVKLDVDSMTPQQLADEGEKIIFGGIGQSKVQGAIGKGQCPLCHGFDPEMLSERSPNLWGITARKRLHPTSIEYIAESHICPSCYVVGGFGVKGTENRESPMPAIHKPPISLRIDELIAVDTWLFFREGEIPPPPEEIKVAYQKFVLPEEWEVVNRPSDPDESRRQNPFMLADGTESVDQIFARAQCVVCHIIPGIPGATGTIGPKLAMRSTTPVRLKDTAYKGKAKSVREYVTESILHPNAYVVKTYPYAIMPTVYGTKLSGLAIDKMVNYLSQIEEDKPPPRIE